MSTLAADAIGAVVAALSAAPAVADVVTRSRVRPLQVGQATMAMVRPVEASVLEDELAGPVAAWETLIAIECSARPSAANAPDVAVDGVLQAVHARMAANPTLGGVVLAITPRKVSWDLDADGDSTVAAVSIFSARQRANGGAL